MIESRVPQSVRDELTAFGHKINLRGSFSASMGRGQAVEVPMFENMVNFVLAEHMNQRTFSDEGEWGDPRIMDPAGRPVRRQPPDPDTARPRARAAKRQPSSARASACAAPWYLPRRRDRGR